MNLWHAERYPRKGETKTPIFNGYGRVYHGIHRFIDDDDDDDRTTDPLNV